MPLRLGRATKPLLHSQVAVMFMFTHLPFSPQSTPTHGSGSTSPAGPRSPTLRKEKRSSMQVTLVAVVKLDVSTTARAVSPGTQAQAATLAPLSSRVLRHRALAPHGLDSH